jgi:hypothetical protein
MILIDEMYIDGLPVRYYDGIDYDVIINHPKDGSGGFIYFFIDRWVDEIKKYNRDIKINSIFSESYKEFDPEVIENSYISIYQTDGNTMGIYKIIRERPHLNRYDSIAGSVKGKME